MDSERLTKTLAQRIAGKVCADHESLLDASRDFGGVAESRPRVVVWPESTEDVVAVVRTARETKSSLAVRGAGHSQGGQALVRAGIVIQTQRLNGIEVFSEAESSITAGAGLLWSDLVDTVIPRNRLPTVITDNLEVTLGGTLAVGGVGPASFRHGAQIDHCLGLEIVLGTGEVVCLSAEQQPGLFRHVLGGLGQFGVVTKVTLRLRDAAHLIRTHDLAYDNVEPFLADARQLMAREAVHLLSGFALPNENPIAGSSHYFVLAASAEMDRIPPRDERHFVEGLSPDSRSVEDLTTRAYLDRLQATFEAYPRPTDRRFAHPWVEHFLPISAVPDYLEAVTARFPTDVLLLWPMRTAILRQPMLRLPAAEDVVLVGILCSLRPSDLGDVLPRLRYVDKLGTELGGKRYLSGWLEFDINRWRQHYGAERWKEITSLQRRCDPDHLFRLWERTEG